MGINYLCLPRPHRLRGAFDYKIMPSGVYQHHPNQGFQKGIHISLQTEFQKGNKINLGKKFSEEHKRNLSKSHKGERPWMIGKKHSEESKKRMSIAHKGKKLSEEHKKKIGISGIGKHCGEKCNWWKGGITSENDKIRHSSKFKLWREKVFKFDNWICWICEDRSGNGYTIKLYPHHLKKFSEYPKLRFEINNGLTLCKFCHKTYTDFGRDFNKT